MNVNIVKYEHYFTLSELSNNCGFEWIENIDKNTIDFIGQFYLYGVSYDAVFYDNTVNVENDNGIYLSQSINCTTINIII